MHRKILVKDRVEAQDTNVAGKEHMLLKLMQPKSMQTPWYVGINASTQPEPPSVKVKGRRKLKALSSDVTACLRINDAQSWGFTNAFCCRHLMLFKSCRIRIARFES